VAGHTSPPNADPAPCAQAAVVVPNWNGAELLPKCVESLLNQAIPAHVIVVDNGSVDDSLAVLERYPRVQVVRNQTNLGFAGGVNTGFSAAIAAGYRYVAAFNSDAVADSYWLERLMQALDQNPEVGIAACKLLNADGTRIDSTGDCYTSWGLPFPRGRHEQDLDKYDDDLEIFGASGGASLYRVAMLNQVGLFDEDFFAYLEDVDLSFRTQLAGWKIRYVPESLAYHQIAGTSSRVSGFATRQQCRNAPQLLIKNVPSRYLGRVGGRFVLGYGVLVIWAMRYGEGGAALRGCAGAAALVPRALAKRHRIQSARAASDDYIWSILEHDLPPKDRALHQMRAVWRKLATRGVRRRSLQSAA
jgi:GT2 family glycosyltransferase